MHEAKDSQKEGYEVRDMQMGLIVTAFVGIGILTLGAVVVVIIILRGFEDSKPDREPGISPAIAQQATAGPARGPQLQVDPVADKEAILSEQNERLHSYGILSESGGTTVAHIPIEKAIEDVAQGEVPYRQEPTVAREGEAE